MSTKYGLILHQTNVKTAFLNECLDKDIYIYMAQPDEYLGKDQSNYECKLKQSLRIWSQTIHGFMIKMKSKKCKSDYCIYIQRNNQDMIFRCAIRGRPYRSSSSNVLLESTKSAISTRFEMTGFGELRYFPGIKIKKRPQGRYSNGAASQVSKIRADQVRHKQ